MKLVILCGGQGTRIRGVSEEVPKPMIQIGNKPILWHIMKYYSCYDIEQFVLCLGYKSEAIKAFFLNYRFYTQDFTLSLSDESNIVFHRNDTEANWRITMAETGLDSMTGARIKKIKDYIGNDDCFLLTYGDGVGNIDIRKLITFHKKHGKIMTVSGVRPPGRFGELVANKAGMVEEFNEKPQTTEGWISGGFFVCNSSLFNYLSDSIALVFEEGPMKALVKDAQLMVYKHEGFWQPMDTFRDYQYLNSLAEQNKAPWIIW